MKLFDLREIRAFDLSKAAVERLIKVFPGYPVRESTLEEAAGSDIVCTLTPARGPFVKKEWIMPGAHINAIGADAPGKEELEPSVLKGAVVVVDDLEQSRTSGEINVPVNKGLFSMKEVYGTLGEIISGKKPGRTDDKAITVFDSTGVAVEDIAVAKVIYEKAKQRGGCPSMNLIE
ncbi:MAG: ornithine cyclodeaminase/alanine dehydrogenase [Dehalococcoidia bacterium]|nr:ornithine cyclodeaminase/alanine dehydrogenase [Dehalococcoidia bacterium]